MVYLLDTNICAYIINRRPSVVRERLLEHQHDEIGVSSLTAAELRYGADKSSRPGQNHESLDKFLLPLSIYDFGGAAARGYGPVRVGLERQGTPIGPLDTLIAAHALSLGAVLVTSNTREFERVPGLRLEDWTSVPPERERT